MDDDPANSAEVRVTVRDRVGNSSRLANVPRARIWLTRTDPVFGVVKRLKRTSDAAGVARFTKVNAVPGLNEWTVQAFYKNDPMPTQYGTVIAKHGALYEFGAGAIYANEFTDCRTARASAKCGKFNVTNAVAYARDHSHEHQYNPDYPEIEGTDCTNFLNQILRAGGMTYSGEYLLRDDAADDDPAHQSRWYKFGSGAERCWENGNCTINWIRVQAIVDHLRQRGLVTRVKTGNKDTRITNARPGDFIVFDWEKKHGMDHAVFVTSVDAGGAPNVTSHTKDHEDYPWASQVFSANKQAEGDNQYKDDWTFDMYRIKGPVRFNE